MVISEDTKAYLAGLIDSSGFFYFDKKQRKYIVKGIIQNKSRQGILTIFEGFYKGGKRTNTHTLIYKGPPLVKIIKDLFPYLINSKEKAVIFLNFFKNKQLLELPLNKNMKFYRLYCNYKEKLFKKFKSLPTCSSINDLYNPNYIAGLFDSSGSCSVSFGYYKKGPKKILKHFHKSLPLSISTKNIVVLRYLQKHLGGKVNKSNNQICFREKSIQNIFDKILPILQIMRSKILAFKEIYNFKTLEESDFRLLCKKFEKDLRGFDDIARCNICNNFLSISRLRKYPKTSKGKKYTYFYCDEHIREQGKKYYEQNREICKKQTKAYNKKHKSKKSIQKRLYDNVRNRLKIALKGNQTVPKKHLGCSVKFLKDWLEDQFVDGMSWNNYGEWHIDHKKPVSLFHLELESERLAVNHFTNLQPLWAEENIKKSNKFK